MPRGRSLAITLLMLAVIAAAGVAFVFAQEQKQAKPAVRLVVLPELLSPGCNCPEEVAKLKIALRDPATLGVQVVTAVDEQVVATLEPGSAFGAGKTAFTWDGLDSSGEPVPYGEYKIRMNLVRQGTSRTNEKVIKVVPARRVSERPEQEGGSHPDQQKKDD